MIPSLLSAFAALEWWLRGFAVVAVLVLIVYVVVELMTPMDRD